MLNSFISAWAAAGPGGLPPGKRQALRRHYGRRRTPLGGAAAANTTGVILGAPLSFPMATLHITDIESAINWWRERKPSVDGITACAEVLALADRIGPAHRLMVKTMAGHERGLLGRKPLALPPG